MILKVEIAIVLVILAIAIQLYVIKIILDKFEHRDIEGPIFLSTLIFIMSLFITVGYIYIDLGKNITQNQTIEPKPSMYFPDILTRIPKNRLELNINEDRNNIKNIESINQYNNEFKNTLQNVFEQYDNDFHNTIILTTVNQTTTGKNAYKTQYKKLTDINQDQLHELGVDDELIGLMNNLIYDDIIFIITNDKYVFNGVNQLFSGNSNDPEIQTKHPYWNVPINKNK